MVENLQYNIKIFHYESNKQVRIYSKPIIVGREVNKDTDIIPEYEIIHSDEELKEKHNNSVNSSRNRTVQSIYGITRSNAWDWFITFTFDPKKIDSTDYSLVSKKITNWFDNTRKSVAPDIKYILVPELHKDGKKWHYHGLLSNCGSLNFEESGVVNNCKMIYNISRWKLGYSTGTKVEHSGKVSGYITKYITKELCELSKGKRRFYASKNCLRSNDVMSIDMLSAAEKEQFLFENADKIQYMKSAKCVQSGQIVQYVEMEL